MEQLAFRIYDPKRKFFHYSGSTPRMLARYFELTATLVTVCGMEHQQLTGLHDKRGKEIYEGDIVTLPLNKATKTATIIFYHGMWMLEWHNDVKSKLGLLQRRFYAGEVLGNIYDNPELLQKETAT